VCIWALVKCRFAGMQIMLKFRVRVRLGIRVSVRITVTVRIMRRVQIILGSGHLHQQPHYAFVHAHPRFTHGHVFVLSLVKN